ncbi:MAG: hypothetical protein IKN28_07200 [Firmicutes bacterium]|nr:hypothetical protein [Bacillota bacterium]
MKENDVYFLDCETKDKNLRMTTFSARLDDLIADFAVLCLEDGQVILQPRRSYAGPFAKLINTVVFEAKMRWHDLQCAIHGMRIQYTEEHVGDDLPPDEDDDAPEDDPPRP